MCVMTHLCFRQCVISCWSAGIWDWFVCPALVSLFSGLLHVGEKRYSAKWQHGLKTQRNQVMKYKLLRESWWLKQKRSWKPPGLTEPWTSVGPEALDSSEATWTSLLQPPLLVHPSIWAVNASLSALLPFWSGSSTSFLLTYCFQSQHWF